jgi:hypothetical protein
LRQEPREFWGSTPSRVFTFFNAHREAERRVDQRFGILAAVVANANRSKQSRPLHPQDFFPSLKPKADPNVMKTEFMAVARAARRKAGLE